MVTLEQALRRSQAHASPAQGGDYDNQIRVVTGLAL